MKIYVHDDGETWTLTEPTSVAITPEQLTRIEGVEKLHTVVPDWLSDSEQQNSKHWQSFADTHTILNSLLSYAYEQKNRYRDGKGAKERRLCTGWSDVHDAISKVLGLHWLCKPHMY